MPSVPALGQADLCEFKFSLIYRVSSGIAGAIQRSPVFGIGMEWGVGGTTTSEDSRGSAEGKNLASPAAFHS